MTFPEKTKALSRIFGFASGRQSKREWELDCGPYTLKQFEEAAALLGVGLEKLSIRSRGYTGGCECCGDESSIFLSVEK